MNESQMFFELFSKGSVALVLCVAVWYVARKLAVTYESRIAALERATEICEKDRVELRTLILQAKFRDGATFNLTRKPE